MSSPERISTHFSLNERLIFEEGSPGRRAFDVPALDVPPKQADELVEPELLRTGIPDMPELSEVDVIRHFTRLSTWNYHIDLGLYPLGSCTMKYNPKINEELARLPGISAVHPYQPEEQVHGELEVLARLERILCEIGGMDRATLQPAAGAQGEFVGLLICRAYFQHRGETQRDTVIVPDSKTRHWCVDGVNTVAACPIALAGGSRQQRLLQGAASVSYIDQPNRTFP